MKSAAPARRLRPPHRRRKPQEMQPRALELLEESVHLLRSQSIGAWAVYYAGAGAWVLGFLFFWAHATWLAPGPAQLAWFALGLTGLFGTLKLTQAFFCASLLAHRMNGAAPSLSPARAWRIALAQLRHHAWGLLTLPVAAILALPLGWVWAFYQNLTVLAFTADGATAAEDSPRDSGEDSRQNSAENGLSRMAIEQARLWPGQNHLALVVISLLGLWITVIVAGAFVLLPWLANRLLSIDNFTSLNGWSLFNTTFFACIIALTWLAVDPLIKAFYTLRVFYGRSRRNGEDLLIEIALANRIRRKRPSPPVRITAAMLFILLALPILPPPCAAQASPPSPLGGDASRIEPQALDQAIDSALDQSAFRWRLRPLPQEHEPQADNALMAFLKQGARAIRDFVTDIGNAIGRFIEWLERLFGAQKTSRTHSSETFSLGSLTWVRLLLYGLIIILAAALAWALVKYWRARRNTPETVRARTVSETAVPDLHDEDLQAAQLPSDAWLTLALEQLAFGEQRLALRALYLATLARLGADGHLVLARHKTNIDYENELHRRASQHRQLVTWFGGRRRKFEAVWYGRSMTTETRVHEWLADLEHFDSLTTGRHPATPPLPSNPLPAP